MEMCGRIRTLAASSPGKEPPLADVATLGRREISCPCRKSEHDFSVI